VTRYIHGFDGTGNFGNALKQLPNATFILEEKGNHYFERIESNFEK
jgi:hypothetical protein